MSHQVFSGVAFRKTCSLVRGSPFCRLGQDLPLRVAIENLPGRKRVDRGAFNHPAEIDVHVRTVRNGKKSRSISVTGDASRGIEAGLEQSRAQCEAGGRAGDFPDGLSQRLADGFSFPAGSGVPLLQELPVERYPLALALLQNVD